VLESRVSSGFDAPWQPFELLFGVFTFLKDAKMPSFIIHVNAGRLNASWYGIVLSYKPGFAGSAGKDERFLLGRVQYGIKVSAVFADTV
jgi:hypothetical protein